MKQAGRHHDVPPDDGINGLAASAALSPAILFGVAQLVLEITLRPVVPHHLLGPAAEALFVGIPTEHGPIAALDDALSLAIAVTAVRVDPAVVRESIAVTNVAASISSV